MDRKILIVGRVSFLLIGLVTVGVALFGKPDNFRGTAYVEPYPPASDFALTRGDGSSFQLSAMRGDIVLLFFGYTSCPDVCPTTLAGLNQALEKIGEDDAARVKVIFVTVDPDRDTPERIQTYVNHFNPGFIGLSGAETDLSKVWNEYGVIREIVDGPSAAGYIVDHTARVTMIDGDGNLRVSFGFDSPLDDIVHDLKLILKEK
jgi:protein SCO1/2